MTTTRNHDDKYTTIERAWAIACLAVVNPITLFVASVGGLVAVGKIFGWEAS